MEKKGSPKKESANLAADSKTKIPGLSRKAFGIVKFLLGICLLPFVYSISVAFINEFSGVELILQKYFWAGMITLLIFYLFIWEPAIIYAKGQKLLELIFDFFKPLVRVAPYLLPVYAIIAFIAYLIASAIVKSPGLTQCFIFFLGASMGLHLVFGARSLRSKQEDFLKGNYIFGFSFIYILDLLLVGFFLNVIFKEFSFLNFSNNSFQIASGIFSAVFRQLFLR
jgi:hypothetical protein